MKRYFLLLLLLISACANNHKDLYLMPTDYLAVGQIETRKYATQNEKEVLTAVSQVLQDLGYTIIESETKLGVLTADANRNADNAGLQITLGILCALSGQPPIMDTEQLISVTVVTNKDKDGISVRAGFARIIYNTEPSQTRLQKITDKEIYKGFFNKLDQSMFLTGNAI